jgi:hypothetical protein
MARSALEENSMNPVRTTIAAGLALIALAGGAQAADYTYIGREAVGDRYDRYGAVVERDEVRPRRYSEDRFEERVERRGFREDHMERRGFRDDHGERYAQGRHGWDRPVYGRPVFAPYDDCRTIIRRKINHWGEMVVRRVRICR